MSRPVVSSTARPTNAVDEILKGLGFIEPDLAAGGDRRRRAAEAAVATAGPGAVRVEQIDAMRFIAFCTVALIHVAWTETREINAYSVLLTVTRYSLPFFFMAAGFVVARQTRGDRERVWRLFRRLASLFFAWVVVYNFIHFFVHDLGYRAMPTTWRAALAYGAATLNSGGVAFHLWFLPWLGVSVIVFLGLRRLGWGAVWGGSLLLYALGLAVGPYNEFTGIFPWVAKIYPDPIAFTARNGPFFGPLFVAMGAHLAVRGETLRRIPVAVLALAVAAGLALFAGEALLIAGHGIKMVSNFNFLAGSAVFAPALFLLVLAAPMNRAWRFMARLGRYGVGMYCVHGLFTLLWNQSHAPADRLSTPLSVTFAAAVGVIVVSAVVTMALARAPLLRRFVT